MNDRQYKKQKDRVRKLAETWLYVLGFGDWDISILWGRERLERSDKERADGLVTYMDVSAQWEYRQATIRVALPELVPMTDNELERAFLHEAGHLFLNEMRDWASDKKHEEHAASMLSDAFQWTRRHFQGKLPKGKKKLIETDVH